MRDRALRILSLILLVLACLIGLAFASRRVPVPVSSKPTVAATFFPLKDIVEHIAGEDVTVLLVVPPGASPHTFEPSPMFLRELQSASAIYGIGYGIDNWSTSLSEASGSAFVIVDKEIVFKTSTDDDEAHSDGKDPHYWLTIKNAKRIAKTVADDLAMRFPDHTDAFRTRLAAYEVELDQADAQIHSTLSGLKNRKIVTFHSAWYYFADAYGLEIVGTFEPSAGREPTPQFLAELSRTVSRAGIHTIYYEPEFSPDAIRAFADDHQLTLRVVDPEGITGGSYIDLMLENATAFSKNE